MSALQPNHKQSTALAAPDVLQLFESAPNAYLVVLPDDPLFTIVGATDAYLQVTRTQRSEITGRGIFEVFPDNPKDPSADGVQNLHASFRRALDTRAPDRMPLQRYDIERPAVEGGGFEERYWQPLNTPILGADGRILYLIHWVEDATDKVRADQKTEAAMRQLRASEKRFRQLTEATAFGLIIAEPEGAITYLNPAMRDLLGYTDRDVEAGLVRWDQLTPPEYAPRDTQAWREVLTTGKCMPYEKVYIAKDGKHVPILIGASLLDAVSGRPEVAAAILDLTERKQSTRDAFLVRLDDAIRPLIEPEDVMQTAARLLGEHLYVDGCAYCQFDPDEDTFTVTRDYVTPAVPSMTGSHHLFHYGGAAAQSFRDHLPYVVEDAAIDSRTAESELIYRQTGIRALASAPLHKAGRLLAAITVYQRSERRWLTEDIDLLQTVANRCWESVRRAQAEAEQQQQWHTFDTALSHTPDFTYIFDRNGRFTYLNRALLSLFQLPLEQALGKDFFELGYPPELAKLHFQQIQQIIETRQPLRAQTPFTGPAGQSREYEYIFVPVIAENGEVEAISGSTRDVTDRNKAEQLTQDDNRRWRDLLIQTPASIAVLRGPEHRFEWVNPEYVRLVGRPTDKSLLGKSVREALPELASQGYIDMFDRVYQTGEAHEDREAMVSLGEADGIMEDRWVNFVCLATRDNQGRIDGTFIHATDITDLVKARKHIEDSEQQFRTLAESIPNLAWMADGTGHIFWYNRRWYDYTGTTFEEMEGWGWEKVHDPLILPSVITEWTAAIETGQPFEMVFPLKRHDGKFGSFLTRVEPITDTQGAVVRWFGTNTDITDQRRTEEELRRMNRELEEFAYVSSHDLQEPLRMVNIYSQLIVKRSDAVDPKLNEYADFVRQGVTRMQALIQDLLTFSRTVHPDELPIGTADLTESLAGALSALQSRIQESGATITASSLPAVRGDTSQLVHVFQNLISNSLKYCDPNRTPEIAISATQEGHQWVIAVQDNGIGFDQKYAKQIFGLFKRLHKDEYPGTGLGLAICQRMIERYGGRMWAEATVGQGATLFFALPQVEEN